ncbi:MAG: hypothetical protein EOM40_16365 [Clostridia bacterium]|nr:hypothetical protein [Clostridia bacterium]
MAVNNGIFDYDAKTLLPFLPYYVFLSKYRVNYNARAKNVVIHNDSDNTDWDIESWMSDLSDDPEITELLWEILGAVIRPLNPWDKSTWFYSEQSNNGNSFIFIETIAGSLIKGKLGRRGSGCRRTQIL